MNTAADRTTASPRRDRMRPLRYLVRTPLLLAHVGLGLPLTVITLNPLLGKIPVG